MANELPSFGKCRICLRDSLRKPWMCPGRLSANGENDQASPDSLKMIRLAEVLDTDIEYLTTGRRNYGRRPPVVLKTVETVEKVIEKPVVRVVEKVVEKPVEKTVVQYVEKPVIKKVFRTKYLRNPAELAIVGIVCFLLGLLVGYLL